MPWQMDHFFKKWTYVQIIDIFSVWSCSTGPWVQSIQTSGAFGNWDRCWLHTPVLNWVNSEHLQNSNLFIGSFNFLWNLCVSRQSWLHINEPAAATKSTSKSKASAHRHLTNKILTLFHLPLPILTIRSQLSDIFCCFSFLESGRCLL